MAAARIFRTGRISASSPDEAAERIRDVYPGALKVVLMSTPEIHRPYEYVVELQPERSDGNDLVAGDLD